MNEPDRKATESSVPASDPIHYDTASSHHSETHNTPPSSFGTTLAKLSDSMNENLIVARYTTMAAVGILAVYGLAHTPLFFRYRTVAEIPATYFTRRRTIHCRLVKPLSHWSNTNNNTIMCQVRHLSPMERILSKAWFDWFMRMHPAAAVLGTRRDEVANELLTVQIAAIVAPPVDVQLAEPPGQWWEQLVHQRTSVCCQLLARRVRSVPETRIGLNDSTLHRKKRKLNLDELDLPDNDDVNIIEQQQHEDKEDDQVAIVKMYYRPKWQLFPVDIGEHMVRYGRAGPCPDGLYPPSTTATPGERIRDASDSIRDLRSDSAYADRIAQAEFEAAKGSYGMWSDPRIRETRGDVVEEVEFQTKAPWWRKVLRWIQGD